MIKVLIVDDSALMRRQFSQLLEAQGDIRVVWARNGQEAVEMNQSERPDVVTLDINMPVMDGIEALSLIMATRPVPVIMLSSLSSKGALLTFEALALGAVDYMTKPSGTISLSIDVIASELVDKIREAAKLKVVAPSHGAGLLKKVQHSSRQASSRNPTSSYGMTPNDQAWATSSDRRGLPRQISEGLVVIGVSTGGPCTLEKILQTLPAGFAHPIVVIQHMPGSFTGPFAERINRSCALEVLEVNEPTALLPGKVYIARGDADAVVTRRMGRLTMLPRPETDGHPWHPSVELMGRSVLEHCKATNVLAIMLTGMGYDGADAFAALKEKGAKTIAESEASCVVFGMPRELIERGGASTVLNAKDIGAQMIQWGNGLWP
ncbi:chemotaxis-specific protein-glutamate methyltransferase CheB [Pokkaliibacter sp. CJK22405]|uniref:chemotaxis-specific protein-glutamate methyltransferase CheB n=1 Tax=Pokkaliibacter sp. CJK22405 TaxID=3384615 RepID=UPI003984BF6A